MRHMPADIYNDQRVKSFHDALARGDLQAVRACPKADLHTHGFAKADPDYIREKTGRDIVPVETPLKSMDAMHEWAKALSSLREWMSPWLELGFHKVLDLSGDEFAQPIEVFQPLYRAAKKKGMHLKAHVGEWGTADDVRRAVEVLELDEVQHGIAASESTAVMRFLANQRIRLNICPTSNLMLGRVARLQDHPIRTLFDAGVKVTVNTDDAIVFGAGVSEDFLRLYRAGVFTASELDLIRQWGLED
jgi:adenosine deaminase